MQRAYWRCNSGHYFSTPYCPHDGWSRPYVQRLFEIVQEMEKKGDTVSIEGLRQKGLDEETLKRVIVIEFGLDGAIFDAIIPEGYVIDGKFIPLVQLGPQYL